MAWCWWTLVFQWELLHPTLDVPLAWVLGDFLHTQITYWKVFFIKSLKLKDEKVPNFFNLKKIYYVPFGWQFGVGISSNKAAKKATQCAIFLNCYFQTKSSGWKNPFCCLSKHILRERNPLIEILKEIWQFGKHVINHIFHCPRWTFLPILCEFK